MTASFWRLEIMATETLSGFLGGYQRGIEVAVAGSAPDESLGVREAFRRYFQDALDRQVPVAVVPRDEVQRHGGIAGSDLEAIAAAESAVEELARRLGSTYQFYVAAESAIQALETKEGASRLFLRYWVVVRGPSGGASGASSSIELPARLVAGVAPGELTSSLPGTRRAGGLFSALTSGLESRRSAVATATLAALSTLFFGILETPRAPR